MEIGHAALNGSDDFPVEQAEVHLARATVSPSKIISHTMRRGGRGTPEALRGEYCVAMTPAC